MGSKRRYDGKVAWITGGGSGIGEAIALELARQGARVAVSGRRIEKLEQTVERIEKVGGVGLAVTCDVTDEQQIIDAVAEIVSEWGRLDVAIANAGFGVGGPIEKLDADDWRRQFDTNVVGLAITVKHALPELKKVQGRVVLMGSVAGTITAPGTIAYNASKFAVRGIGLTLAIELVGTGVSCTTIQPGFVESEIGQVDNDGKFQKDWKDTRPKMIMWTAKRAAEVCVDAIWEREREFTFTRHGKLGAFLGKHTPGLVYHAFAGAKRVQSLIGSGK